MPDNKLEATSIIEKIINERQEQERLKEVLGERREEYKQALNGMASTPNGQYFLKVLLNYCGVFSYQNKLDPAKLVEDNGLRKVYLEAIRPFLTPENKEAIE